LAGRKVRVTALASFMVRLGLPAQPVDSPKLLISKCFLFRGVQSRPKRTVSYPFDCESSCQMRGAEMSEDADPDRHNWPGGRLGSCTVRELGQDVSISTPYIAGQCHCFPKGCDSGLSKQFPSKQLRRPTEDQLSRMPKPSDHSLSHRAQKTRY